MKQRLAVLAAVVGLAASAAAESGIRGPVAGFVLDTRIRAIRPINGMPGAAVLGPAVPLSLPVRQAAISKTSDFALAISEEDGRVYLVRDLPGEAPDAAALEGAVESVAKMTLNGASAVLYSKESGRVQTITGLPGEPRMGDPMDAPPGELTALSISPDGSRVAAGTDEAVYLYRDGGPHLLAAGYEVSAIAFRHDGRDLVLANRATNEILSMEENGGASVLAGEADGVDQPVGLASVNGDRELWIANAGSGSALVIDEDTPGAPQRVTLPAAQTRCEPLDGRSVLVFNDAGNGPVALADWARGRTAYFVPAGEVAEE
jgi:hypothetical protein